jgi:peptide/nickel transport system substrate-binding protein
MKPKIIALLMVAIFIASILAINFANISKPVVAQELKGPKSPKLIFKQITDDIQAMENVKTGGDRGGTDIHFFRAPFGTIKALLADERVVVVFNKRGGFTSLIFNNVPMNETGKFNPFEYKEFRQAMQFAAKRLFMVSEILVGYGTPMLSAISSYDPDWPVVADVVEEFGLKDDLAKAKSLAEQALVKAGAVKGPDGKWRYGGEVVKIKIFIRADDAVRFQYGEGFAAFLADLGFEVEKIYGDLIKAFYDVYGSDPKELKWHIYTEGWGAAGFIKYSEGTVSQFYAPWLGFMPGWATPGYWNYENKELDDLTQKLVAGNYTSKEERDELLRKALKIGLEESVRIFLTQLFDAYVYNKERVKGLVNEYGGGLANRFTAWNIEAVRSPDKPVIIGVKYLTRGSFNPIGGLTDLYSVLIYNTIAAVGLARDPHNGDLVPFHNPYRIIKTSTTPVVDVPADAIVWDPETHQWKQVGPGVKAKSAVEYDIVYSNWHDGSKMNIYDILYSFYFMWEWSHKAKDDPRYSAKYKSTVEPFIPLIKGIKVVSETKVQVYVDYWHFDEAEVAAFLNPWTSTPWQLLYAMEQMYIDGKGSWFVDEAVARGNEWIDPISPVHAAILRDYLDSFYSANKIPDALTAGQLPVPPITLEEAKQRYLNSRNFIAQYGHAIISNGPYIMTRYLINNVIEVVANRNYPFGPEKWAGFAVEKLIKVVDVSYVKPPKAVTVGETFNIDLKVNILETPAKAQDVIIKYWFYNPKGAIIAKGDATFVSDGLFRISLSTSGLTPDIYSFKIYAVSRYAYIPEFIEGTFILAAPTTPPPPPTSPTPPPTPTEVPTLTPTPTPTPTPPTPPTIPSPTPTPAIGLLEIIIIVLAIVIIAALAVIFLRRPKPAA